MSACELCRVFVHVARPRYFGCPQESGPCTGGTSRIYPLINTLLVVSADTPRVTSTWLNGLECAARRTLNIKAFQQKRALLDRHTATLPRLPTAPSPRARAAPDPSASAATHVPQPNRCRIPSALRPRQPCGHPLYHMVVALRTSSSRHPRHHTPSRMYARGSRRARRPAQRHFS